MPNDFAVVLTGDVINMSLLPLASRERLGAVMRRAYAEAVASEAEPSTFHVFRGDGWQLYHSNPVQGLRLALWMRASVLLALGVDLRIALAVGRTEFVRPLHPGESDGPVFRASGKAHDAMHGETLVCVPPPVPSGQAHRWSTLRVMGRSLGFIMDGWTANDADAVLRLLADPEASVGRTESLRWDEVVPLLEVYGKLAGGLAQGPIPAWE